MYIYSRTLLIVDMCILQDNEADWSIEASRMSDVYSQEVCTIAATSAKDSNTGLFFERESTVLQPRRVEATLGLNPSFVADKSLGYPLAGLYWCDIQRFWTQSIEKAHLNSRAWVNQERQLSPRTMHFSDTQLFWECHGSRASENYPSGLPNWALPDWTEDTTMLKRRLHNLILHTTGSTPGPKVDESVSLSDSVLESSDKLYFSWSSFRIRYTQCKATREEDKLVAIQGIPQRVGQALGDRLVAGLWYNHILEELCWYKRLFEYETPSLEPTKWRAPTWIWASSNAKIWVSNTTKYRGDHQNKQIEVKLDNLDVKTKPSGEPEYAFMRIQCRLMDVVIEPRVDDKVNYYLYGSITFTSSMGCLQAECVANPVLKIDMDHLERERPQHVHIMVVQRCLHTKHSNEDVDDVHVVTVDEHNRDRDCVEGLLLVAQNESNNF